MKKQLITFGTIVTVLVPTIVVVSCSNKNKENTILNSRVAFISDNNKIRGNQFLESTEKGVLNVDKNAKTYAPKTQVLIDASYKEAIDNGADTLVTTGFGHEAHIKKYALNHQGVKFIYVDGQITAKNITSIYFNMKEISFIAGYKMAASDQVQKGNKKIGLYGAVPIPAVDEYIKGIKDGVDYFNKHLSRGEQSVTIENQGYVGSFATGGVSETKAITLVNDCSLVVSVGGGQ